METIGQTTSEALVLMDDALSSIDDQERGTLSGPVLVVLMSRLKEMLDRVDSLMCVLTDEATRAQESSASTAHVSPL